MPVIEEEASTTQKIDVQTIKHILLKLEIKTEGWKKQLPQSRNKPFSFVSWFLADKFGKVPKYSGCTNNTLY